MTAAIELHGVGKRYQKYQDTPTLVSQLTQLGHRSRRTTLWALRDVDLQVERGERVGIIGRNGSGKSTLLSILAGVTSPTTGRVAVRGRAAPLLSVGVGFHPELTGRENVFVNGRLLGMSEAQLRSSFDDIVEFAGIGDFLDTPVKFYSSGMFVRLGFSVAVAAAPEVLLVDEVLAVGDVAFRLRCHERMQEIAAAGTTLVVVTHSLYGLRSLCPRTVLLDGGRIIYDGPTDDAVATYVDMTTRQQQRDVPVDADPELHVAAVSVAAAEVAAGGALVADIATAGVGDRAAMRMWVAVYSAAGTPIYSESLPLPAEDTASWRLRLSVPLAPGRYELSCGLRRHDAPVRAGVVTAQFEVAPAGIDSAPAGGVADLRARAVEAVP